MDVTAVIHSYDADVMFPPHRGFEFDSSVTLTSMSATDDLDALIERSHQALDAFTKGDAAPLQALFSQRDDVTLANPFGPAERGWPRVCHTMARAAEHYRDGRALGFDQIAKHVRPDIAYIHELERLEAKMGGSDEVMPVSLRCTTVFRREAEGWKIVHRHADPIAGVRSADSVIQN
jgi:ketosteroid isomerase-like protein